MFHPAVHSKKKALATTSARSARLRQAFSTDSGDDNDVYPGNDGDDVEDEDGNDVSLRTIYPRLDPIAIEVSTKTQNLRRWMAARDSLSLKSATPAFTLVPKSDAVSHVINRPVYKNRNYQPVKTELKTLVLRIRGKRFNFPTRTCWISQIQDMNDPNSPILKLYDYDDPDAYRGKGTHAGPIELHICATQAEADELMCIACKILNRMPYDMDTAWWNGVNTWSGAKFVLRRLTELLALHVWNPDFDASDLPKPFFGAGGSVSYYNFASNIRTGRFFRIRPSTCVVLNQMVKERFIDILVQYERIDPMKVESLESPPDTFQYATGEIQNKVDLDDPSAQATVKLIRHLQYRLLGMCGTKSELDRFVADIVASVEFTTVLPDRVAHHGIRSQGPYDGKAFYHVINTNQRIKIIPSTSLAANINGVMPNIRCYPATTVYIAYVLQQMLLALAAGMDEINVWQTGHATQDAIELGMTTVARIIATYCTCLDHAVRLLVMHICMTCYRPQRCIDLTWNDDGLLVCAPCLSHTDADLLLAASAYKRVLHKRVEIRVDQDIENRLPSGDEQRRQQTITTITDKLVPMIQGYGYIDGYSTIVPLFYDSLWRDRDIHANTPSGTILRHPMQPSIENVLPFSIIDGQSEAHHVRTTILTPLCINSLKGTLPPAVLPLLKYAATLRLKDIAKGSFDVASWEHFDRGADHIFLISREIPNMLKHRLAVTHITQEYFDEVILPVLRNGIYNGSMGIKGIVSILTRSSCVGIYAHRPGIRRSRASYRDIQRVSMPNWPPWNDADQVLLSSWLEHYQDDPKINVSGVQLLRAADGAPWFWRKDHYFQDHSYYNLWAEMKARLQTMWEECNYAFETAESPLTLVLLIARWYFKTGGRDNTIGCELTVLTGHPQIYSLGRSASVEPSSVMRSGFTNLRPTDFENHYDESSCTIVVQAWLINRMHSNYPTDTHSIMSEMLLALHDSCEHYTGLPGFFPSVTFPLAWRPAICSQGTRTAAGMVADAWYTVSDSDFDNESWDEDESDSD